MIGASSSRRFGWPIRTSREVTQRERISASVRATARPGLPARASTRRSMIESRVASWRKKIVFFFREREISFFLPSEREVEVSSFSSPPFFRPSKGDERLGAARRLGRGASLRFSLSAIEQI